MSNSFLIITGPNADCSMTSNREPAMRRFGTVEEAISHACKSLRGGDGEITIADTAGGRPRVIRLSPSRGRFPVAA